MSIVGESVKRIDAFDKVTGRAKFINDINFPDQLVGKVLFSNKPHAYIKDIDIKEAFSIKGVHTVLTYKDIPGKNINPLIIYDQPFLAEGKVRLCGEALALVAAEDEYIAQLALEKIKIKFEDIEPILSPEDSLKEGAVKIHEKGNILKEYRIFKGDVEKAFLEADLIHTGTYTTGYQEHAYIETNGMIALIERDGSITVYGSMQCPFYVQKAVATILNFPFNKVRVVQTVTGGGFGGKEDVPSLVAAWTALLAYKTGKPVKLILNREEDIISMSKRHPSITKYKTAVTKEGKILGTEVEFIVDGGAYTTLSSVVLWRGTIHAVGAYKCENVKITSKAVATNKTHCGAYRGFGIPQVVFASEVHYDEIAHLLGIEPSKFREINALKVGDEISTGQKLKFSVGLLETIKKAKQAANWDEKIKIYPLIEKDGRKRGIGMSTNFYGVGLGAGGRAIDKAGSFIQIYSDGSIIIAVGTTEMGQGANTVLAQIAAETLGVNIDKIHIMESDTTRVPDSGPTVASRTTLMSGNAIKNAAEKLKEKLLKVSAEILSVKKEDLNIKNGLIEFNDKSITFEEAVTECFKRDIPLFETGWYYAPDVSFNEENGQGNPYPVYSFSTNIVEVLVDIETGEVTVDKAWSAHDIGKSVNPQLCEGQIQGGFVQGLGLCLYEELKHDNYGKILNPKFSTYILPTIMDVPEINPIIVEEEYPAGPYGVKGLGELPPMGVPPAVVNAIFNATGIRLRDIPITPEKLRKTIKERSL